ncbi:hypothetical protein ACDZ28_33160 [Paenibacillus sp. RS8]|nr:hypothetical protein [Paenibacillus sp. FSL R5-0345]
MSWPYYAKEGRNRQGGKGQPALPLECGASPGFGQAGDLRDGQEG